MKEHSTWKSRHLGQKEPEHSYDSKKYQHLKPSKKRKKKGSLKYRSKHLCLNQKIPVRRFAAVERAAPVTAHCTTCSWEVSSHVIARAIPVIAPATALFFCTILAQHNIGVLKKKKNLSSNILKFGRRLDQVGDK